MLMCMPSMVQIISMTSAVLLALAGSGTLQMASALAIRDTGHTHTHVHMHDGHVHIHTHTHAPFCDHSDAHSAPHLPDDLDLDWCHDHHGACHACIVVPMARIRSISGHSHLIHIASDQLMPSLSSVQVCCRGPDLRARPPDFLQRLRSVVLLT
tara:strand:- start:27 stop:488 length:462 start_codon:yes stop_codon:yes gene_type:complete